MICVYINSFYNYRRIDSQTSFIVKNLTYSLRERGHGGIEIKI